MKSLISKVTSIKKLTTSVGYVLLDLNYIICIEISYYIHTTKFSITLK